MCLEYIETDAHERRHVRWAIKEALSADIEPVNYEKLAALGWQSIECPFCGSAGAQAFPQRTWVGLAAEDRLTAKYMQDAPDGIEAVIDYIEAKLKEKNGD